MDLLKAHQVNDLVEHLLLVSNLTDHGVGVVFLKDQLLFVDDQRLLGDLLRNQSVILTEGPREGRLYYLEKQSQVRTFCATQSSNTSLHAWHLSLSHLGVRGLQ